MLVPRGAEEQAVRRAAPAAVIVPIAAAAASAKLPAGIDPAAFVVVVGVCGSLSAARVGDVVVYTRVVDASGSEAIAPDDVAAAAALVPQARPVVACMTDRIVTRAADRVTLAARFGADVVDMEGVHLARALRARGLRFAMVRVVSDDPRFDLPAIEDALAPGGGIRPLVLAAAFARAPLAAVRFVRDVQASLRVLGSVGAALGAAK
jgi:hypothetical protein